MAARAPKSRDEQPTSRPVESAPKLVSLVFKNHHMGFCPGEVGALNAKDAAYAVKHGLAVLNDGAEESDAAMDSKAAEEKVKQLNSPKDKSVRKAPENK